MKYRTKDGDVLDAICAKHYADLPYRVEDVLAANPGLAAFGPVLPSGLIIDLPKADTSANQKPTIRLWN
jgi:phage tail protein X